MKKFTCMTAAVLILFALTALAQSNSKMEIGNPNGQWMAVAQTQARPYAPTQPLDEFATALYLPKISMLPGPDGSRLQILNPEQISLTIELKNAREEVVNNWMAESLTDDAPKQVINGADLQAGTYWVEVSAPNFAPLRFRWLKK